MTTALGALVSSLIVRISYHGRGQETITDAPNQRSVGSNPRRLTNNAERCLEKGPLGTLLSLEQEDSAWIAPEHQIQDVSSHRLSARCPAIPAAVPGGKPLLRRKV